MKLKLHLLKLLFVGVAFSSPELYSQTALPGTLEAEDGVLAGGAVVDGTIVSGLYGSSRTVTHSVTVATAGNYDFAFTYSRNGTDVGATVKIADPASTIIDGFTLPGTGGTSIYATETKSNIYLSAGTYELVFNNSTGGGMRLDKYVVTETPASIDLPGTVEVEDGTVAGTATVGDGNGDTSNVVTGLSGGSSNSVTNNVSVAEAGYYNFEFTYFNEAAGAGSATMEVVSPSSTVFSTFSMPIAGTSGAYATVSNEGVFLDSGTYELKFYNDNANAISLDNYVVTSYEPTTALPGTVQVEYGTKSGGNETTGVIGSENGGTNNVRTNLRRNGSDTVITNEISLATDSADNYQFTFYYYSSSATDRTLTIKANGGTVGTHEMVKNSDDAGVSESAYGSFTVSDIDLPGAGTYDIELHFNDPGGVNIDYYTVVDQASVGLDDIESVDNSIKAYPNPSDSGVFNLKKAAEWEIFSLTGVKVLEGNGTSIDAANLANGSYILKITNTSQIIVIN